MQFKGGPGNTEQKDEVSTLHALCREKHAMMHKHCWMMSLRLCPKEAHSLFFSVLFTDFWSALSRSTFLGKTFRQSFMTRSCSYFIYEEQANSSLVQNTAPQAPMHAQGQSGFWKRRLALWTEERIRVKRKSSSILELQSSAAQYMSGTLCCFWEKLSISTHWAQETILNMDVHRTEALKSNKYGSKSGFFCCKLSGTGQIISYL